MLLSKRNDNSLLINEFIILISIFILFWLFFIIIVRSDYSSFIIGKYIRSGLSAFIISLIVCNYKFKIEDLIKSVKVILLIHVLCIAIQSLFPILDYPMAKIFGFERESDIISSFSIRKLGCSSSYDTSGYLCVASIIFFLILYTYNNIKIDFLFSFISLIASFRTSRTGMILGILIFFIYLLFLFIKSKGTMRIYALISISFLLTLFFYFVLPIIIGSTDLLINFIDTDSDFNYSNDYSSGSLSGLTSSHLDPLSLSFIDLLLGFGIDPNQIGKVTDIGYVKIIYHIGIIGLIVILTLYGYLILKLNKIRKNYKNNFNYQILTRFLIYFIFLLLLINYKSLEIFSRGSHDFLIIIFLILLTNSTKHKIYSLE
jgi:hypothetical protein